MTQEQDLKLQRNMNDIYRQIEAFEEILIMILIVRLLVF